MTITAENKVGEIATEAPLAARVFAKYGIDFCCGGGTSLRKACEKRELDADAVVSEIHAVLESPAAADQVRWDEMPLDALIEHILGTYHRPLDTELPRIRQMAERVHEVHGAAFPELGEISALYGALHDELAQHMAKEEQVLFPMILGGNGAFAEGPVSVMEHEHVEAGTMLRRLRELAADYVVPDHACNTWRALWAGLEALEKDLHEHIHLENNILFPRALGRTN